MDDIKDLLKWDFPGGVLSVYVDVEDRGITAHQRWKANLKSGLNGLTDKHADDKNLAKVIETAHEELLNLPPEMRNRSLIYFRSLNPEKSFWRSLQLPVKNTFVWMNSAFLRPAVAILDEAPIMGITIVSKETARILTWRQGLIDEKEEIKIEIETGLENVPQSGRGDGQVSGSFADRFQHKVEVQINKRLGEVAAQMAKTAQEHGWQNIILMGSPKYTDVLEESLTTALAQKVVGILDKNYINSGISKIEEATTELLHNWKRQREKQQVVELLEIADSNGKGVVGIQKSIDALEQGRADHFFFSSDLFVSGWRDTNGELLVALSEEESEGLKVEPHIIERMVELSFESNAKITPLEGEASEMLKSRGGAGVILRY
jgi:peptide subunit release factor 1 (eRF1)